METPDRVMVISATVVTTSPDHAVRAAEVLARAASGLILDGIDVSVSMGIPEDDDPEEPAP